MKSSSTRRGAQRHSSKRGKPSKTLTRLLPGAITPPKAHLHGRRGAPRHCGRQGHPIKLGGEAEPLSWLRSGLSQQSAYITFMYVLCIYGQTWTLSLTFGWIWAAALKQPRLRLATRTGNP